MEQKSVLPVRTPREPRARATLGAAAEDKRTRIFVAAARLFAKFGYRDTTVDKIVKEAGVAKGTFFVHFETKESVVTELVRNQVRAARQKRDSTLSRGGSPVEALRATVLALGEQAAFNRELSRAVVTANLVNPLLGGFVESVFGGIHAEMRDDVRAAQRIGLLTAAVNADTIADTLITSYLGATLYFATAPHTRPLLELLEPVVDANLAGFATAPASDKREKRDKRDTSGTARAEPKSDAKLRATKAARRRSSPKRASRAP